MSHRAINKFDRHSFARIISLLIHVHRPSIWRMHFMHTSAMAYNTLQSVQPPSKVALSSEQKTSNPAAYQTSRIKKKTIVLSMLAYNVRCARQHFHIEHNLIFAVFLAHATNGEKRHRNTPTSICLLTNCLSNRFVHFIFCFCYFVCWCQTGQQIESSCSAPFGEVIVRNNSQDGYTMYKIMIHCMVVLQIDE